MPLDQGHNYTVFGSLFVGLKYIPVIIPACYCRHSYVESATFNRLMVYGSPRTNHLFLWLYFLVASSSKIPSHDRAA